MRCHICDADSDSVSLTEPCAVCQAVIADTIAGYPSVEDDQFLLDPEMDHE